MNTLTIKCKKNGKIRRKMTHKKRLKSFIHFFDIENYRVHGHTCCNSSDKILWNDRRRLLLYGIVSLWLYFLIGATQNGRISKKLIDEITLTISLFAKYSSKFSKIFRYSIQFFDNSTQVCFLNNSKNVSIVSLYYCMKYGLALSIFKRQTNET